MLPSYFSSPPAEMTPDEMLEDETVDCHIVEFLKDEILSYSNQVPKEFILKVVILLNKGSILSSSYTSLIGKKKTFYLLLEQDHFHRKYCTKRALFFAPTY